VFSIHSPLLCLSDRVPNRFLYPTIISGFLGDSRKIPPSRRCLEEGFSLARLRILSRRLLGQSHPNGHRNRSETHHNRISGNNDDIRLLLDQRDLCAPQGLFISGRVPDVLLDEFALVVFVQSVLPDGNNLPCKFVRRLVPLLWLRVV